MTKEQTTAIPEELYNLTQLAEVTLAAGRLSTTNASEIKDYINSCMTPDYNSAKQLEQQSRVMLPTLATATTTPAAAQSDHINNQSAAATTATINSAAFYSSSDDDSNYYSHKIFDRKKLRRSTISDNSRFDEHSSCSSSNLSIMCGSSSNDEHMLDHLGCDGVKMNASDSGGSLSGLLDDEHICPECGKKYSTSSNLARHRQTHRSIMDKKARRCPYCEKVYVSMPAFSMHVRTHNQGCECQYCGKCFSRPWLLQGHIRTHTGEKPFKCSVCNKAFADKSNLRAHIQTHSNTKPHSCARCGKAFALKSYLYKHEESSCMKNHSKTDKESRSSRNLSTSSSSSSSASSSPSTQTTKTNLAQISNVGGESAKFTLASKLLQKRANPNMISTNSITEQPLNLNSSRVGSDRNIEYITMSSAVVEISPTTNQEKSYTTITNPMSQEDYERFKRISVIRTPPTGSTLAASVAYPEMVQMPMHFYSTGTSNNNNNNNNNTNVNTNEHHMPQDIPVDFSPKNNFTHSSKTSPFEVTGNYAIVA